MKKKIFMSKSERNNFLLKKKGAKISGSLKLAPTKENRSEKNILKSITGC